MFVDLNLSPLYKVISRKVHSVLLISWVNLMAGWTRLMFDMNY